MPRAVVQIVAADGTLPQRSSPRRTAGSASPQAPDGCNVRAALPGFQPATAECSPSPLRLSLALAPVTEVHRRVGHPHRSAGGPGRIPDHGLRRRRDRAETAAAPRRSPASRAGDDGRENWRPGNGDVAVRSRRREQLHEGPARRRSAERAGRRVQPEQHLDGEPGSNRVRPRRQLRALRIRCDDRRDPVVHAPRRRPSEASGHGPFRRGIVLDRARLGRRRRKGRRRGLLRRSRRAIDR